MYTAFQKDSFIPIPVVLKYCVLVFLIQCSWCSTEVCRFDV